MPTTYRPNLVDPYRVLNGQEGPFEFDFFSKKYLAQGDSWFSIGALPPGFTTNILAELQLARSFALVNCARPGKELSHMTDTTREPMFLRLLTGRLALTWDAILLSGGGNDLIDAVTVGPDATANLRLLATPAERGPGPLQTADYLSAAGWATFETHLGAVFDQFIASRDSGPNQGVPLLLHTYTYLMPRPASAGPGFGPWLQPAMAAFAIPQAVWADVSKALIDQLAALLQNLIAARTAADPACNIHLVDTRNAGLVLADPTATGASGDFANEIHPSEGGYEKLAAVWNPVLDALP